MIQCSFLHHRSERSRTYATLTGTGHVPLGAGVGIAPGDWRSEARIAVLERAIGQWIALLKGGDNAGSTRDARAPAKKNAAYAGLL